MITMVHKTKLEKYVETTGVKTDLIWAHYYLNSKKNPTADDIRIKDKVAHRLKNEFGMK